MEECYAATKWKQIGISRGTPLVDPSSPTFRTMIGKKAAPINVMKVKSINGVPNESHSGRFECLNAEVETA